MATLTARLTRVEAALARRRQAVAQADAVPRDPVELARRAGITLDPWQLRAFQSKAPVLLINCSRQAGKSTIVALIIVKYLLRPEQTVVIIAPFWRSIGRPVPHLGVSKTALELAKYTDVVHELDLEVFDGWAS